MASVFLARWVAFLVASLVLSSASASDHWDASKKASEITLSDSDRVAERPSSSGGHLPVLGVTGRTSGKWYFEVALTDPNNRESLIGFATSGLSMSSYLGSDAYGWGWLGQPSNSHLRHQGSQSNMGCTMPMLTSGSVVGVAIDLDARTFLLYLNGGEACAGQSPKSFGSSFPTGVPVYPAAAIAESGDKARLRVFAEEFSYSPPVGYSAWGSSAPPGPGPISWSEEEVEDLLARIDALTEAIQASSASSLWGQLNALTLGETAQICGAILLVWVVGWGVRQAVRVGTSHND